MSEPRSARDGTPAQDATVAAAAPPAPGAPVRLEAREHGFRAIFPEAPRFEVKREATLLGTLETRSWEVGGGALLLRVERHDLPALAARVFSSEWLLERAERDLLADVAAREVEREAASLGGHPGRRLRYEPGERPGEREEARIALAGRRMYVVFARGAGEAAPIAARFAESVEILGE